MLFIGKLLGGILGLLMAGPYGALFGIFIGNFFDKSLKLHLSPSYLAYHNETRENIKTAFIKAAACLMGLLAKADGRVSESEINFANYIFKQLKLDPSQMTTAKQWFTTSKNGQVSFDDNIRMLKYLKEMNLGLCRNCFDICYQMAKIDGLNSEKIDILNQLLSKSGFIELDPFHNKAYYKTQYHYQSQYQHQNHAPHRKASLSLEQAYNVLNIDANADKTQVKRAYRKLISSHHPDRMIAKGASKQEIKAATEKTQQISKAYQLICDTKGW